MQRGSVTIGLIGDYDANVPAHQAIPIALTNAAQTQGESVAWEWVPTETITDAGRVEEFDGLWCVPASPYRSMEGALLAIEHARTQGVPFLGTCGGFQHAIVEYARNVLGWADADHAETAPDSQRAVVSALECSLVEVAEPVHLHAGSRIATAYGTDEAFEAYRCRYGINPAFREQLVSGPLRLSAEDAGGDIRAVELDGHPFFVAALFQPERAALRGEQVPLATALVRACALRRCPA
jgi:CTP synthase (UTP-ammonia lyase)